MEGACDCIYNPLMGPAYPSFTMIGPQIAYRQNTICFGTLSVHWMEWCTTRRDIHCLWSVSEPFLGTSWSGGGLQIVQSICKPLVSCVSPCHSPAMFTLQLHTKQQISGTLLVWQMSFYTVVRDIHCLWSVPNPSLGTWRRYEVLLAASASYLWISSCHFG